jgi:diguanylate cyclase (GGDEF)-like protein/PAS domain S-box-containing protein
MTVDAVPRPLHQASVAILDALFHGSLDGIALLDEGGRVRDLNASAAAMFGIERGLAVGHHLADLLATGLPAPSGHDADPDAWLRQLGLDRHGGRTECSGLRTDGNAFPLDLRLTRVSAAGAVAAHVATLRDLTDLRAAEQAVALTLAEMEAATRRYEAMLRHAAFAIVLTDVAGVIQEVNPAARRLLGLPPTALTDMPSPDRRIWSFDAFVCRETALAAPRGEPLSDFEAEPSPTASWLTRLDRDRALEHEVVLQRTDGHRMTVLLATTAMRTTDGSVQALLHIAYDITERREHEARLHQLAFSDPLTGLGNRALLEREVESAIGSARRQGRGLCLLFIDLDRFKLVNDSHGHAVGDEVLQEVARRLQQVLRAGDVACRLGGDEFVVLLPAVRQIDDGHRVASKLQAAVAEPIVHDGLTLSVGASIGVVNWPEGGEDMAALMRAADLAMYDAKRRRA